MANDMPEIAVKIVNNINKIVDKTPKERMSTVLPSFVQGSTIPIPRRTTKKQNNDLHKSSTNTAPQREDSMAFKESRESDHKITKVPNPAVDLTKTALPSVPLKTGSTDSTQKQGTYLTTTQTTKSKGMLDKVQTCFTLDFYVENNKQNSHVLVIYVTLHCKHTLFYLNFSLILKLYVHTILMRKRYYLIHAQTINFLVMFITLFILNYT